jgi:response regulator NasT
MTEPNKPQILLVDDDRLVLATISKGLKKAGYSVVEAAGAREAVKLCEDEAFDLAILDIRMPEMTGTELARELHDRFDLPFLVFSAYGDYDLVEGAIDQGALGYLVKPLDVSQIIPSIEAALTRWRDIRKLRDSAHHLNTALQSGRDTSTAVGILMERYRLSNDEAFEMLRSKARSLRRKVSELAAEVIQAAEQVNSLD